MSAYSIAPTMTTRPRAQRPVTQTATTRAVRLTARGRAVLGALVSLVILMVALMVASASAASRDAGPGPATQVVTVTSGDTLWGIASELADDGDVPEMIEQIKRLNALEDSSLFVGQKLNVPVG